MPISCSAGATPMSAADRFEPFVAAGSPDARLRRTIRRRPLHPLHRRHDRPPEGRGVASGGHLLRRARRREPRRPADRQSRSDRRVRRRQPCATIACVPPARRPGPDAVRRRSRSVRSCTRAANGRRSARCSAAASSCSTPTRTSTWRACSTSIEREHVNAMNLVGDASARPLVDALRAEPDRYDTSSLLLLGSGGSMLSGDVKGELLQRLPSVLGIVEGIGSSESPAQAVALTTRDSAAPTLADVRGQGRDDRRRRRSAPDPAGSGRGRPARDAWARPARLLQGSGPQRAHVRRDRRGALVVARRHGDDRRRRHGASPRPRVAVHQHRRREGVSPKRSRPC